MQRKAIALWRWTIRHRRELVAGTALLLTLATLVAAAPWLLAVAAVEFKQTRRRRRLLSLALLSLLFKAVAWLWTDLRNLPHGPWHACAQCGAPIEAPSRAWYCSPACRRYARLERHAAGGDERAKARLEQLTRPDVYDPELAEVPF